MNLSIGKYMKIFDTDTIDIGRRIEIENPDGSTGETLPEDPIYLDVPCHLSFQELDNPDVNSFSTKPKIMALKIECSLDIDLQNNDFITAKKLDNDKNIIESYKGNIGYPATDQNRSWAIMNIREDV